MFNRLLPILFLFLFLFATDRSFANTDARQWTFTNGEQILAELVSYDEKSGVVKLRKNDSEEQSFSIKNFSQIDQSWLVEWTDFSEELDAVLKELGGRFVRMQSQGKYPTNYYVYYPEGVEKLPPGPMLILFSAGGKAERYLKRHLEAAKATGMTLVACGSFRNTSDKAAEDEMLLRFQELLPQIEKNVRHDASKVFMGGDSGGATRAYHYSAKVKRPWAGILANGGWLGGPNNYDLDYPAGMRVAMVNGHEDKAANHWMADDTEILNKHGNTVAVFAFEGGHQVGTPMVLLKAMWWLLGRD